MGSERAFSWVGDVAWCQVSMLPVALLDIRAGHLCLDTCASPGSKTAQMLSCLSHAPRHATEPRPVPGCSLEEVSGGSKEATR